MQLPGTSGFGSGASFCFAPQQLTRAGFSLLVRIGEDPYFGGLRLVNPLEPAGLQAFRDPTAVVQFATKADADGFGLIDVFQEMFDLPGFCLAAVDELGHPPSALDLNGAQVTP